jgi:uncharacterized protein (DUF1330 family)
MPKGYWVALIEMNDPELYPTYREAATAALAAYGGRFLVRAGAATVREGSLKPRVVVVEFANMADAVACYESPAYQQAKAIREAAAVSDIVIVEGWEG